jgi:hypothetical protein
MFIKKLGVAAALTLVAVSASASNFRGADQVYIPTAGHLGGQTGTFISDVYLANLAPDDVEVSVIYVPINEEGNKGQEFRNVITLRGQERREFPDFFKTLGLNSGFGQLIFNGCAKGKSCGPETQDTHGVSENFRPISAESRIYQIPNGAGANPPTTGQLFSGIPWYSFVSSLQNAQGLDKVFITGLRQTGVGGQAGTFRSNIGLVNASQYSTTDMIVTLYQGTMTAADQKGQYTLRLGPLGNVLKNFSDMFGSSITGSNFFVTVEQRPVSAEPDTPSDCVQGCPAFLAYGSVLDNISGDATTLEPQYLIQLDPAIVNQLYPNGSGKGFMHRAVRH